jgi:hypothetical protein
MTRATITKAEQRRRLAQHVFQNAHQPASGKGSAPPMNGGCDLFHRHPATHRAIAQDRIGELLVDLAHGS